MKEYTRITVDIKWRKELQGGKDSLISITNTCELNATELLGKFIELMYGLGYGETNIKSAIEETLDSM
jgi:hypothetical protein